MMSVNIAKSAGLSGRKNYMRGDIKMSDKSDKSDER